MQAKLLIVDDEPIERQAMQAILQKAFPEIEIRQAKNGKIAIEIADEWKPDIVFMDILMPGLTGLEAIAQIQEKQSTDIQFVMVTAFETFEYAKQAIKLGVKDYLLKPSKASEIAEALAKILDRIKQERQWGHPSFRDQQAIEKALALVETDVVTQLLFDHVHEVHIDMLMEMLEIQPTDEKFVMVILVPNNTEHYYSKIKERLRPVSGLWMGAMYGRQLPIIVFRDEAVSFRSQAVTLANHVLELARETQDKGWFVGFGNVCFSLDEIRQSYQESLIATMDSTYRNAYRFYADVPKLVTDSGAHSLKQDEKKFFDWIRKGEWERIEQVSLSLLDQHEGLGVDVLVAQQRLQELIWVISRVMEEIGVESDVLYFSMQPKDYRMLKKETAQFIALMRNAYRIHGTRLEEDKVHQIKQYITDHSHEDISLETLASKVELSPIYISKIFKEKLGVNYIDFLTQCRIEKTKKLLADSGLSLKEITFEVGYHDPNYFSKVFKKMCGISPSDYRKSIAGVKE